MIDRLRGGFINCCGFVVREPWRRLRVPGLALAGSVGLLGCSPQPSPAPPEDSVTSGRIRIVCAREVLDPVTQGRDAFVRLYPDATIDVVPGTSRDAVRDLFGAQCDLAVITRDLDTDERRAAVEGKLELQGYLFARSAVVAVVPEGHPVENLALEDLRRIYRGEWTDWSEAGGPRGPIVPVIQEMGSDVTDYFIERVMNGESIAAPVAVEPADSTVVRRVARTPGAIGFVSLGARLDRVRALRLASMRGLPYTAPDLEAVHRNEYPLARSINLYVREDGPPLANGFITFMTSMDGQRIVRSHGLLPTSVPVRFVRRAPMWSGHSRGDSISSP